MKILLLITVILTSSISLSAQEGTKHIVRAKASALATAPEGMKISLVQRLNEHINYLQNGNLGGLYDLAALRKKKGMSKSEFVKTTKISTEGNILRFTIEKVKKAETDEYSDEPLPQPEEGDKWFVTGRARMRDEKGKLVKCEMGFDLWLTDGKWYVNRGGRLLNESQEPFF